MEWTPQNIVAMVAAIGVVINAVQNFMQMVFARAESKRSIARGAVVDNQLSRVNTKVDAVMENTNGHMTTLIAAVAPFDPELAAASFMNIQAVAEAVKVKLEKSDPEVGK